jgi:peptidoglycan/xylan/chitin deacetylase (PgdA/CDA1 family)
MNQDFGFKVKLRRIARLAWIYSLKFTGLLRWAEWRLARRGAIVVLTFHRVLGEREYLDTSSPRGMIIRRQTFADLLHYADNSFQVIDLAERQQRWNAGHQVRMAFTFDDGWQDNYLWAAPIASQLGVPLVIFICPGLVDRESPFWPERVSRLWHSAASRSATTRFAGLCANIRQRLSSAQSWNGHETAESAIALLKSLAPADRERVILRMEEWAGSPGDNGGSRVVDATMSWQSILKLATEKVAFGSHTQHHEILSCIPLPQAQQELENSKQVIERQLGQVCSLFAYPNGEASPEIRQLVANAGYTLAFLNCPGAWLCDTDPLLIPRVNIWEGAVVGLSQRFSPLAFRYVTMWKAYRSLN